MTSSSLDFRFCSSAASEACQRQNFGKAGGNESHPTVCGTSVDTFQGEQRWTASSSPTLCLNTFPTVFGKTLTSKVAGATTGVRGHGHIPGLPDCDPVPRPPGGLGGLQLHGELVPGLDEGVARIGVPATGSVQFY